MRNYCFLLWLSVQYLSIVFVCFFHVVRRYKWDFQFIETRVRKKILLRCLRTVWIWINFVLRSQTTPSPCSVLQPGNSFRSRIFFSHYIIKLVKTKCNKTRETGIIESRESFVTLSEQKAELNQKREYDNKLGWVGGWYKGKWLMLRNAYKKNKRSKSKHSFTLFIFGIDIRVWLHFGLALELSIGLKFGFRFGYQFSYSNITNAVTLRKSKKIVKNPSQNPNPKLNPNSDPNVNTNANS